MLGGRGSIVTKIPAVPLVAVIAVTAVALVGAGALSPAPALSAQAKAPMNQRLEEVIGFYTGSGGLVDDAQAHDLLLAAVDDGDALSRMWLARVYSRGRMFFERDDALASEIAAEVIDEIRRLADDGHHEAAFLMGTAYAEALGVEENQELAMAWYYRAANLGNMLAQHNLGNAYRQGSNALQDAGMAAFWYHRACDQGDALTCYWLGQFYENGDGVAQDREMAIRWYREAAGRGRADAQEALARIGG